MLTALNLKENRTMEIAGYLKVVIVLFALAIPISIAFLVYRTLFSGLNSISKTRRPLNTPEDAAEPEQAQVENKASTENEAGQLNK
jgi:hypothetical protein